jgi:hypothetical protein
MRKSHILLFTSLLCFIAFTVFAQSNQQRDNSAEAWLIDDFGKLNSESVSARLDNVAVALQSQAESKAHIIVYHPQGKPYGFPFRYAARIKTYLLQTRGFDSNRIITKVGGKTAAERNEIWIVPTSAERFPTISPSFEIEEINKNETFLFDNYNYENYETLNRLLIEGCCSIDYFDRQEARASLDAFAELLNNKRSAKGYLIGYSQYCVGCIVYDNRKILERDSPTMATEILRREKSYLVRKHKIEPGRIVIVNGGFKNSRNVELWIVPENGEKPKPKPTTFPPKRSKKLKKKARSK